MCRAVEKAMTSFHNAVHLHWRELAESTEVYIDDIFHNFNIVDNLP